jgi:hypothetical protein
MPQEYSEILLDKDKPLTIPAGFEIVAIGGTQEEAIKPCAHCGAPVNPCIPACGSCGQEHVFLAFQKKEDVGIKPAEKPAHTQGDVEIHRQHLEGNVDADSIDVENGATVGALVAPDIHLGESVTSASVAGLDVTTGKRGKTNYLILQTGSVGSNSNIDDMTILEGKGEVKIGLLTHIGTLHLDEGIHFHKPVGVKIDNIVTGKFSPQNLFPTLKS